MEMEIILKKEVSGLGYPGEVVTVADGYARNFLIPKGMAERSTPAVLKAWEGKREKLQQEAEERKKQAAGLGEKLEGLEIVLREKAGEEGQLFGSVNAAKLCAALKEAGFEVDANAPRLDEPIKKIGEYEVELRIADEARPKIKVKVETEGAVEDKKKEKADKKEESVKAKEAKGEEKVEKEETKNEGKEHYGQTSIIRCGNSVAGGCDEYRERRGGREGDAKGGRR